MRPPARTPPPGGTGGPNGARAGTGTTKLVAYFDGGSRGNPGIAGAGAVLFVHKAGEEIKVSEHTVYVGETATNNEAEYAGCIRALQAVSTLLAEVAEWEGDMIEIRGDSKLVLYQADNKWACNNANLQPLLHTVQQLVLQLERAGHTVCFEHFLRENNKEADRLANAAMDTETSTDTPAATRDRALQAMQQTRGEGETDLDAPWTPHPRALTPRLSSMPSKEELLALAGKLHEASRDLGHLPPAKLWGKQMVTEWRRACNQFTPVLQQALDGRDELQLLQAVLDLLELPTLHLLKAKPTRGAHCDHPEPAGTAARGNPLLNKAKKLVYMDLPAKAMQALLSNGVATRTRAVFAILTAMHPKREVELHQHAPKGPQIKVTPAQAKQHIYSRAGSDTSSICCFGWSAQHLLHLRGAKNRRQAGQRGRQAFIQQVARLVARIGSADVPEAVAEILTCGALVALHKLDKREQAEAAAAGRPPEIRPVNVGCAFLRWGLKLALASPQAQAAAKALQPIQLGLATRGGRADGTSGPRAAWQGLRDSQNGFQKWLQRAEPASHAGRSGREMPGDDRTL